MSFTLHAIVALKNSTSSHVLLRTTKPIISSSSFHLHPKPHLQRVIFAAKVSAFSHEAPQTAQTTAAEPPRRSNVLNLDRFLSVLELAGLASSAAIVAYVAAAASCCLPANGSLVGLAWAILVGCAAIGSVIRRRQWVRIHGSDSDSSGGSGSYLITRRVERLEEEFRGSVAVIRVLSRQIEKLGNRVRAYRKAATQPIAETAALAQKNSEATRALAAQEDILEKEICEVQKVLLAMQEQQQKQLELILAIGKGGRFWKDKPSKGHQDSDSNGACNSSPEGVRNGRNFEVAASEIAHSSSSSQD